MRPPVSQETFFPAICAGFVAAFLLLLSAHGDGTGASIFVLFSCLTLLLLGLGFGSRQTAIACVTVCMMTGIFIEPAAGLLFGIFIAFPVYYFVQRALLWRGSEQARSWYPTLRILGELTIIAAAGVMAQELATADEGGLLATATSFSAGLKNTGAGPDADAAIAPLLHEWNFLIFPIMGWLWVMTLYGLATLANTILRVKGHPLRPSLAIGTHGLSPWLPVLLAISGILAVIAKGPDRFDAEAVFSLLLLPYLLSGLAFIHHWSKTHFMHFRRLWITSFYLGLCYLELHMGWPLLAVIAIGFYCHFTEMLDSHKGIG